DSKTISSGSGFVIESNGDTVVVATNRHVAVPDLSELPPGIVAPGTTPTIEAVFRSGQGKEEQALPAQIIAADLSDDLNTDLAFLVVKGMSHPPAPIARRPSWLLGSDAGAQPAGYGHPPGQGPARRPEVAGGWCGRPHRAGLGRRHPQPQQRWHLAAAAQHPAGRAPARRPDSRRL